MVYDIAVSGLGPAGISFLKQGSQRGFKVICFDKEKFPRKKVCAGGLSPKAYNLLKKIFPELDKVVKVRSRRFIFVNGFKTVEVSSNTILTYLTDRRELDNFLFNSISNQDVEIHTGETVLSVERDGNLLTVKTGKGKYKTRVVIAADGVNSRVARQFNVKRDVGFTYEADVNAYWDNPILIDFSNFWWGYYWVFPKGEFVTTGLGEFRSKPKKLREKLFQFNRKHGIEGVLRFQRGFPIPSGRRKNDVWRDDVLFLGDAGGLVDPLTGEGIYYAVKSGIIAAEIVTKALESGKVELLNLYKELVDSTFGSSFFWAKVVGHLFFRFKRLNFYLLDKSEAVKNLSASFLSGNITYREAVKEYFKLSKNFLVRF